MAERDQPRPPSRARILALTAGVAVVGSNSLVLSPILGDVAASLAATPVEVSRAVAAYGGATALAAFLLAPRIDRLGARRALLGGMACLAAATLASAMATHWLALALAQALAGAGAGVVLPSTYALATALSPPAQEARTLGRVLTGWSVSLVAGVPASALVADAAGWRASFLALAALAGLAALGAVRLPGGGRRSAAEGRRWRPLEPLGYPTVPTLLLVCLAYMAAFYGVYAFLGDHARATLGLSAGQAGLIVLAYGIGFGAAGLGDGVVDRLGPRRAFPGALLAVAASYALMVPAAGSLAGLLALAAAWGLANHFGLNILVLLLSRARPDRRGAVLGLNSAVTYLGALAGVAAAGVVYERAGFAPLAYGAAAMLAGAAALAGTRLGPEHAAVAGQALTSGPGRRSGG